MCVGCISRQYCKRLISPIFRDDELRRPFFQTDFRAFLFVYTFKHRLCFSQWHEHLCGLYRDYRGWISDQVGDEVFLDMEVFEHPNIREWFRDYIRPVPLGVRPRLRGESKERVRTLATIMRAYHPEEAMMWGVRAANDN